MDRAARQRTASAFFGQVFGLRALGHIELRSATDREKWRSTWSQSAAGAAKIAVRLDEQGRDVYFGVGLRDGRKRDSTAVHVLLFAWADLDAHEVPPDELADALIEILARLRAFPLQPSIVIASARGYHCYWLLDKPGPVDVVCAVVVALARLLGDAGADARVFDAARILRVPGTHHRRFEPRLVAPFGAWWQPGQQARRYTIEELLAATDARVPTARTVGPLPETMPALLALVAQHATRATRRDDGRVSITCFFHDDTTPSAVVFANGRYFCSACHINEPAPAWTKRPEVARLGFEAAVVRHAPTVLVPEGFVKAPRSAMATIAPLLLSRRFRIATTRRGRTELRLLDRNGTNIPFDQPEALAVAVREKCGGLAFRCFWAAVYLAQADHARAHAGGRFAFNIALVADLLGFPRGGDGRHHHDHRHAIEQAMTGLATIEVRFRWSETAAVWFNGPIVVRLGEFWDGDEVYQLHLGLWRQIIGSKPAWVAWQPAALKLDEEALAVYLHARWQLRRAAERNGDVAVTLNLASLAAGAGVWNAERCDKDRGRYLGEWARRLARAADLGVVLHVQDRVALVHVQAPSNVGHEAAVAGTPHTGAAALCAYFPDLPTPIPEYAMVSQEVRDRFPRDPTVFPRDPTGRELPDAPARPQRSGRKGVRP